MRALVCSLVVASLYGCGDATSIASESEVAARSGCYVIYLGVPSGWVPAAWRSVDTSTADRLRFVLTTKASASSVARQGDRVVDHGSPRNEDFRWWPTEQGMRIVHDGHHPYVIDLNGDSVALRGTAVSEGEARRPMRARRVPCEDGQFTPGFESPNG